MEAASVTPIKSLKLLWGFYKGFQNQ